MHGSEQAVDVQHGSLISNWWALQYATALHAKNIPMNQPEVTAWQKQNTPMHQLRSMPVPKQGMGKGWLSWQDQATPLTAFM